MKFYDLKTRAHVDVPETNIKKKKMELASLTLVPSDGGVFEVEVDGRLVFSKSELGRFPEWAELEKAFGL